MITSVIVDDEIKGRQFLQQLLHKFVPRVKVAGEATNAAEAKELIEYVRPDLVFLDIEMPGKTGIEMLQELPEIKFEVIFVTAFNTYAVEAFRLGAVDYLLKPVSPPELMRAVDRVEKRRGSSMQQKQKFEILSEQYGKPFSKITVPNLNGFEFVDFSEIIYMQSEGNYTHIRLAGGKQILATRLLGEFEEILSPYNFFRVHKSFIINLLHIKKYTKGDGGVVMMSDGAEIDVARRSKDAFLRRIQL
ncbi:MAG: LytTR family DNA-binding domain-containing protein [Chitinophagales bacterium]|nr:LytTR family DNA-binding domain-containing protein [Chitinophagales bacterium]